MRGVEEGAYAVICWVYLFLRFYYGEFDGDGKRLVAGKLRALELVEYTFFLIILLVKVHGFDIHCYLSIYNILSNAFKILFHRSPIRLNWSVIGACLEYSRYEGRITHNF